MALVIAGFMVTGLIIGLGAIGLLVGVWERYWSRPKLTILRSQKGANGFAFHFQWDESKASVQYNVVKLKLFNPFGAPRQVEMAHSFEKTNESFVQDLDMGPAMGSLLQARGLDKARVQVELNSRDGVAYQAEFKAMELIKLMKEAGTTVQDLRKESSTNSFVPEENFWTIGREFIADTVPGKGAQVAIPTNPAFAAFFQGTGASGGGAADAVVEENFAISKVWIEEGCIVCNACEDIYPEVFKVIADGCEVIPGHPSDDGLKVLEAAEACPVEIIKFAKA